MKRSDDDINDEIKKALQASFENFEGDFGKSFDKNILGKVNGTNRKAPLLIAILLLFVATSLIVWKAFVPAGQGVQQAAVAPMELNEGDTEQANHAVGTDSTGIEVDTEIKPEPVEYQSKKTERPAAKKSDKSKVTAADRPVSGPINLVVEQNNGDADHHEKASETFNKGTEAGGQPQFDLEVNTKSDEQFESILNADNSFAQDIHLLENRKLVPVAAQWNAPEISTIPEQETRISKQTVSAYSLLFSIVPVKTYYNANIKTGDSRIQNLSFPARDLALGYKVNFGFERKGYQLLLNFSQINSQVRYEYGLEKFERVEVAPDQYAIKRVGEEVASHDRINLLGISVKKQVDFSSTIFGNGFVNVGAEYARALNYSQKNWVLANMNIGKRIKFSRQSELHIGPYFEYSFTKQNNANKQLLLRPYQLGLSIGLKVHSFQRNHQ